MKAFLKFFLISFLFFTCGKVLAFNSDNILYYDSDNIKIKISDKFVKSNSELYYQFINVSSEEVDSFENKNNVAYDKLSDCINGSSSEKCISDYNLEKDNILSTAPSFGDNWNKISGSGSIYSIPKFSDNYFLWIKAKDADGKDIYSLFYESSSFESDAIVGSVKTTSENNISNVVAIASIMFSIGGMISFIVSIIYIIKYSNLRVKLNY